MLSPRPTPHLKDHPLSALLDGLFIIFAAILRTGGRSSTSNKLMRHAVVTGNHLTRKIFLFTEIQNFFPLNRSYSISWKILTGRRYTVLITGVFSLAPCVELHVFRYCIADAWGLTTPSWSTGRRSVGFCPWLSPGAVSQMRVSPHTGSIFPTTYSILRTETRKTRVTVAPKWLPVCCPGWRI